MIGLWIFCAALFVECSKIFEVKIREFVRYFTFCLVSAK